MCVCRGFSKRLRGKTYGIFWPSPPLNGISIQTILVSFYVQLWSLLQTLTYGTRRVLLVLASPGSLFSKLKDTVFMCGLEASSKVLTSIPMFSSLLLLLSMRSLSKLLEGVAMCGFGEFPKRSRITAYTTYVCF
jgi:hypothetical protein